MLPQSRLYAVGLSHPDGVQQAHFVTPLPLAMRQTLWDPALSGISFQEWTHDLRQWDPSADPFAVFLTARAARLLIEWPLLYMGSPGADLESLGLITTDAAVPRDWPARDLWIHGGSLAPLVSWLVPLTHRPAYVILSHDVPLLLAHSDSHLVSLAPQTPTAADFAHVAAL